MAIADYETLKKRFGQAEADRLTSSLGSKGNAVPGAPTVPTPPTPNAVGAAANPPVPSGGAVPTPPKPTMSLEQLEASQKPPVPTAAPVPTPPNPNAKGDYFNRTYGGQDNYAKNQQDRFNAAYAAGDQDLISRLQADAARVGYTLNVPTPKAVPAPAPVPTYTLTPDQIQQEAGYQIGKERADLKTAVDWMIAQAKNNANYANQQIKDNRVLEDAKINRSLNPFSGRSTYDKAMIGRGRAIDDTYRATNLENELTKIQSDLYNFDKLAPDKQRALVNEMTRIERDYGLQVGQLTGYFNGQRTLAGQQFDWSKDPSNPANVGQNISNKIAQIQLDNLPAQTKFELQQLEQRAKQGEIDLQTAEWQLKELTDPNSVTNRSKALQLQMQELEARNLPEQQRLELQRLRKQIAEIGKEPTRTEAQKMQDQVTIAEATKRLQELQNGGGGEQKDFSSHIKSIEGMYVTTDPYTKQTKITDKTAMRNAIIALGMSDDETDRYLTIYGLPTN